MRKLLAWAVHVFTASGLILCFLSLIALSRSDFRMAFIWLFIALIVDGFDGMMARAARVTEVLPMIHGKIMDHLIDFISYAFLPAYFFYVSDLLPDAVRWVGTCIILLSSILYYAKEGMVSSDYYFVGFPVLWNLVAFYLLFVFHFSAVTNFILIVVFGILHFIPLKYAYPSRMLGFRRLAWVLTLSGLISAAIVIWGYPRDYPVLQWILIGVLLGFSTLVILASRRLTGDGGTSS
ncbi:MAG: CDP-alcohol phosphatidyltransferase family protein [Lewinellaceae bacterium]|nr:CDP-alcohol phosphatidyltransferase family protein [Lewinellaceae bacterium]HPQ99671.1 CDP-alcohol phosphatidyltransferase family protein [Saprospiraceae bacterium]